MVLDAVRQAIATHAMISPGDRVLVAVSGGADSVVLLHALNQLAPELGITLHVAHLNHGWRGDASDGDEAFVAAMAKAWGIDATCERLGEADAALHRGAGREGAAREMRREFLLQTASRVGAARIVTGHTKNDRAETILFNLTRGTGLAGLSGIDPVNGPFIRPLLSVRREDILDYARAEELEWREDDSNQDISFDRNRIRHRILPGLAEINSRVIDAICRAGDHSAGARTAQDLLVSKLWPDVALFEEPDEIHLSRNALCELAPAIQSLLLREGLRRVRGDLEGIDRIHTVGIVDALMHSTEHGEFHVPRGHVRIDSERIHISVAPFGKTEGWEMPADIGRTEIADGAFFLDLRQAERDSGTEYGNQRDRTIEVADADKILFPLQIRNRRAGDRFTPLGMSQPIKLKDFLINARVPFFSRDQVPLLCDREKIIWVVGVRLSEDVRVTSNTKRILEMRLELAT